MQILAGFADIHAPFHPLTKLPQVKRLFSALLLAVLLYCAVIAYVAVRQDSFLYQPSRESESALLELAAKLGMQPIRDGAGEITGWRMPNRDANARIVVFHGGSGHALQRADYARALHALGWDVTLFEYPGFGARSGRPGRTSFLPAGARFVEDLLTAAGPPVYLLGESMGSGTACAIAREKGNRVAGLALVVPYARLADVAKLRAPYLPVDLILRDTYDNVAALQSYGKRVVVVIADKDEVVGPEQGTMLYTEYKGPKRLITLQNYHHADFPKDPAEPWWRELSDFLTAPE